MFRYGFWWRLILAVIVIVGLVGGGWALYQNGVSQGYVVAQASAAGGASPASPQGAVPAPVLPYGYYPYHGWGFSPFWMPFRAIAFCGSILLLFFIIGGIFSIGRRRRDCWGPWYGGPRHFGRWYNGPRPGSKEWQEWMEQHKGEWEKYAAAWHGRHGMPSPWEWWGQGAAGEQAQPEGEPDQPPAPPPDAA
jgi:hypothetical protein